MAGQSRVLRNEKIHEKPHQGNNSRIQRTQPQIPGLQSMSATHSTVRLSHTKLIQIMVELVKNITNLLPIITPFRIANSHQWLTLGGGGSTTPPPPKFRRPSKIVPNSTRL